MTHVLVIGGGIAGLSTAYYLSKQGVRVTVADRGNLDDSASIGNAGFLSMFDKSPFSYPGVFSDTARAMARGKTPLVINKYLSLSLLRWGVGFYKASKPERYRKTLALLDKFGEEVFRFYESLTKDEGIDCDYARNGFAMVYTDRETYRKKVASIPSGSQNHEILTRSRIAELFPFVEEAKVTGAIALKRNGMIDPGKAISGLKEILLKRGVAFLLETPVNGFRKASSTVSAAITANGEIAADIFILATGADSGLSRDIGCNLNMTPGRGYSITFPMDQALKPKVPVLFSDLYTAITPRRDTVRITGKIEFGPSKNDPRTQAESMLRVLRHYTKEFDVSSTTVWSGNRPLTPNDLPYLGWDKTFQNVMHVTGLGHTGMNIGPICGRIAAELIGLSQKNSENSDLLQLSAFFQR